MKIAIVGSSPRTRDETPYDDPEWQVWGINTGYNYMKRWDRLFDLHDLKKWPDQYEALKPLDNVWTRQPWPDLKSTVYPIAEVIQKFGSSYFTNSVSYLVALAMYEGADEIAVYGVEMAVHAEYKEQRPSCEYWLGRAEGMGIKVTLPESCELCRTTVLYGYDVIDGDINERQRRARSAELQYLVQTSNAEITEVRRVTDLKIRELEHKVLMAVGALDELRIQGMRI